MSNWFGSWNFACIVTSNIRLAIFNRSNCSISRNNVALFLKKKLFRKNYFEKTKHMNLQNKHYAMKQKGGNKMTIVVKKVPKFLRGIVKLIFGIKDNT